MEMFKCVLKDTKIVKIQKTIDMVTKMAGSNKIYWIFTEHKMLLMIYDDHQERMKQIFEFRTPFFNEYEVTENFTMKVTTDSMKIMNKILFNFHRLNIQQSEFLIEKTDDLLRFTIKNLCGNLDCQQSFVAEYCKFTEFEIFEDIIEKKMSSKVLFLITNINALEMLHLFKTGQLMMNFDKKLIQIKDSRRMNSDILQINSGFFKSYDFRAFEWVMSSYRAVLFTSNELSQFIKTCNRVGVLIVSVYVNTRLENNQIEFHFIGDCHNQSYYKSIKASIVDPTADLLSDPVLLQTHGNTSLAIEDDKEPQHTLPEGFVENSFSEIDNKRFKDDFNTILAKRGNAGTTKANGKAAESAKRKTSAPKNPDEPSKLGKRAAVFTTGEVSLDD